MSVRFCFVLFFFVRDCLETNKNNNINFFQQPGENFRMMNVDNLRKPRLMSPIMRTLDSRKNF